MAHQTCSARFRELSSSQPPLIKKLLLDDGSYAKRKTRSGRGAYVYVVTDCGADLIKVKNPEMVLSQLGGEAI